MKELKEIVTICPNPGCDRDIVLAPSKILRAMLRKPKTGGKALIGCPVCCHVMVLPDDIPTDMGMFTEYMTRDEREGKDWLGGCVPMLDSTMLVMPVGSEIIHGTTMYTPGEGTGKYDKYAYMAKFGIDPECAKYDSGKKSFKVGT